ncbi:hypothetical protein COZ73_02010 [Candidatus Falkowbacteria bacterium CG_4_8_14_3_um_filter_36_11]|nr:MAG: hypothetical protein COZ73_02010 [Candidatus Falkowbacteria bacterium CG_4_8_14_3_um_filter_36_11]
MKKKLKVLMASAEIAPFVKVGGLADVAGSLPPALKKLGCDVRLAMPFYGSIAKRKYKLKKIKSNIEIYTGRKYVRINLWQTNIPGSRVIVYLIEQKKYFGKDGVYYGNNVERFLFFSLAALYALPAAGFKPDIIHCHDYHTALIPDMLKAFKINYYRNTKTIYTIHNLNYQGVSLPEVLSTGSLTKDSLKTLSRDARDGDINFMVQGILNADMVNTVSRTYAKEIMASVNGDGLENIIKKRKKDLYGIINGIDVNFFNPAKDALIKYNYSYNNISGKIKNKIYLQKKLGLPANKDVALIGFVSRLVSQKGIELITERFAKLNCQFVFLGTGKKQYEDYIKKMAKKYPDKVSAQLMFNVKLAQEIYAGSDIFLMPSRFEPCGLGQMIAMRYGSVPVVRATGGLVDTVDNLYKIVYNIKLNKATGFIFKNFKSQELYKTLKYALAVYYNQPETWQKIQTNGMQKDFSWNKSAREYMSLYKKLKKV